MLAGLFVAVVVGVIAITESQRRIPTQSAKHVRGRRVFGGTRQYLPLKVNQAGVMPIIFASSLLIFPSFIFNGLARATQGWRADTWSFWSALAAFFQETADAFQKQSYIYTVFYIVLIYFFCYFWTAITFNPKDMSENLKDYGSFIPGYRPGRRTADYLEKVMLRITYVGAAFLSLVAVIPVAGPERLERRLHGGLVSGRDRAPDRHQRLPRPGAEDRQPPDHAELRRPGEQAMMRWGRGARPLTVSGSDRASELGRNRDDERRAVIKLKSPREIALMRDAGRVVARALAEVRRLAVPGATTADFDAAVSAVFREHGAIPLFKNYPNSVKGKPPFPAVICASINEQVVHGIPNRRVLREGDVVSIDTGCKLNGWCGDAAVTLPIGTMSAPRSSGSSTSPPRPSTCPSAP